MSFDVFCMELSNVYTGVEPDTDLVFVHGLSSSADAAWRNKNNDLWPLWFRQVFPQTRILLLNYPASSMFYSKASRVTIRERAHGMADLLPTIGIGKKPTVFVCHSLGGILVKELLRTCVVTGCSPEVAANTIGAIFLATPHSGSNIAKLAALFGSALTKDLATGSEYLTDLSEWFAQHAAASNVRIAAYYETQKYNGAIIVSSSSADPQCLGCSAVPVDENHSSICKPESPNSDIFIRIKRDVDESLQRINSMTTNLISIEEIVALPEITNHMYFDIINFLNRYFSEGSRLHKAYIVSNPCGNSRPCCIIVTRDPLLIEFVDPLVRRWPDRFSMQFGIIGELTNPENLDSDLPTSTSKGDMQASSSQFSELIGKLMGSMFYRVFIIHVSMYWDEEEDYKAITAGHAIESQVRDWCSRKISQIYKIDVARLESAIKRSRLDNADIEKLILHCSEGRLAGNIAREECLLEAINQVYINNKFRVRMYGFDKTSGSEKLSQIIHCKIHQVDYSKDRVVLSVPKTGKFGDRFRNWAEINQALKQAPSSWRARSVQVGEELFSTKHSQQMIHVDEINQTVFFPMIDKITSLKGIIVLSGLELAKGDSGSPIVDKDGKVVAMIIGRAHVDGIARTLAVSLTMEKNDLPDRSTTLLK